MVYEESIIDVLHTSVTTKLADMINVDYPENMFRINIANIRIDLYINNRGIREGIMFIPNDNTINSEYIKIWKNYAPGKFLITDYRKNKRDADGNTPYYVVHYTHGKIHMKALLRRLIELDDENVSDKVKTELKNEYGDLMFENHYYAVIKICNEDITGELWMTQEKTRIDIIHSMNIETIDDITEDDKETTEQSEPEIVNNTLL